MSSEHILRSGRLRSGREARRWVPVVLLGLLVLGVGVTADAQRPGRGKGQGRGQNASSAEQVAPEAKAPAARWDRLCERLELTDEQREQIETIRMQAREQRQETHQELARARHALKGEFLEEEPALSKARDLARKIGDLETDQHIARLEQHFAIREILSPEQRDRLHFMHQRRGGHHGGQSWGVRGHGPRGHGHRMRGCGAPGFPGRPGQPGAPAGRPSAEGFFGDAAIGEMPDDGLDHPAPEELLIYGLLLEDGPLDE